MLPMIPQRAIWASGATYVTGEAAGDPNKLDPANADVVDGHRPGDQPSPEIENRWKNDMDRTIAALRSAVFNTRRSVGPVQASATCIARKNSTVIGLQNTNKYTLCTEEFPLGTTGNTSTYAGEGGGALFASVVFPDVGPSIVLAGSYSGGTPATGAVGLWSLDGSLYDGLGALAPIVRADHATPHVGGFLFACPGSNAYNGTAAALYRINGVGVDFDMLTGSAPPAGTGTVMTGGTYGGHDSFATAVLATAGGVVKVTVGTGVDFVTRTTYVTAQTGTPLDIRWNPESLAFDLILSDGTLLSVDPGTGATTTIQPANGLTYTIALLSRSGYVAKVSGKGLVMTGDRGATLQKLPIAAQAPHLFDGECYWFPSGNGASGAGAFDWITTLRTVGA